MPVSIKEVKYMDRLARLRLSAPETKDFQRQLSEIVSYVKKPDELDTGGVAPLAHPLQLTDVMRDGLLQPGLEAKQTLKNAPRTNGPFFSVPKVVHR